MIAALALVTIGLVSWKSFESKEAGKKVYQLDQEASSLKWKGSYASDGHTHEGSVQITEGSVTYKGTKFEEGSFVVDLNTIKNTDLPDKKKPMLEGHLKSPDFFNVEKYAKVPVTITEVTEEGIKAKIMVVGKEIEATMPVKPMMKDGMLVASGKFDVDFASTDLNGFKAGEGKPANQHVNTVISFDLNLVLK